MRDQSAVISRMFHYACAAALALSLPSIAGAQSGQPAPTRGAIAGQVLGPRAITVPGVTVFLKRGSSMLAVREVSDADGNFRIEGLAPGTYQVMASIGNLTEAGPIADVAAGSTAMVSLELKLNVAEQVSVTADVWTLPVEPPNSVVSWTFDQMRQQNLFNPEDAVRNVPSTTVRKRYIGDRNGLIGGRSFGTLQPSRALVYLDGYLLSNFLGRFDAPRWNMITPEALERVDVLYGPFSAVHAGNSIGTTIVMTERIPTRFDWGFRTTGASQGFTQYGSTDRFNGGQVSAYVGGHARSGLWAALAYNHEEAVSQPMTYFTTTANAAGAFPSVTGPATRVAGILYDTDPRGLTELCLAPAAKRSTTRGRTRPSCASGIRSSRVSI
jgi:hypothetical protein